MGENAHLKNGHVRIENVRFRNASVSKNVGGFF